MNKPNEVSHKGITVRIGKRTTIVNGKGYSASVESKSCGERTEHCQPEQRLDYSARSFWNWALLVS